MAVFDDIPIVVFTDGAALSQLLSASSSAQTRHPEARSAAFSVPGESLMQELSSFEEVGVLSIEVGNMGDSPTLSSQYEELVEVMTPNLISKQEAFCSQNHSLNVRACLSFQIFTLRYQDPGKSHCPPAYLAPQSIIIHLLWGLKRMAKG